MTKPAKTLAYSYRNNDKNTKKASSKFVEEKTIPRKRIERLKDKERKRITQSIGRNTKIEGERACNVVAFKKL